MPIRSHQCRLAPALAAAALAATLKCSRRLPQSVCWSERFASSAPSRRRAKRAESHSVPSPPEAKPTGLLTPRRRGPPRRHEPPRPRSSSASSSHAATGNTRGDSQGSLASPRWSMCGIAAASIFQPQISTSCCLVVLGQPGPRIGAYSAPCLCTDVRCSCCPVSLQSRVHQGTRPLRTMPMAHIRRALLAPHCRLPIFCPLALPGIFGQPPAAIFTASAIRARG